MLFRSAQEPREEGRSPAAAAARAGFARRRPLAVAREKEGEGRERRRRSRVPSGPLAGAARGTSLVVSESPDALKFTSNNMVGFME